MKIVIAPDSFKESLSAPDVAAAIARGWTQVFPDAEVLLRPMADGGEGTVDAVDRGFRRRPMLRVALSDDSGATLVLRFFHFRAAQVAQFAVGTRLVCYGTPRPGQHGLEIVHPSYRVLGDDEHVALGQALDPVYPAVEGIGPATLRKLIETAEAQIGRAHV